MNHDSRFYDTLITVDGKIFKTHKYILCKNNSSFFLNLFKNAQKPEKYGDPIILDIFYPIKKNIFQLVLNILYKNEKDWSLDLEIIHQDGIFELFKTCYLLDIYFKPTTRGKIYSSKLCKKIAKDIEKYDNNNVNYIDFFNPCIKEINTRIKNGDIRMKDLYLFLKNNVSIYKCQFSLENIISQIVDQSNLNFIDQQEKNDYNQKLFRDRVFYSNPNISIQQIHIDYIGKLLETH